MLYFNKVEHWNPDDQIFILFCKSEIYLADSNLILKLLKQCVIEPMTVSFIREYN